MMVSQMKRTGILRRQSLERHPRCAARQSQLRHRGYRLRQNRRCESQAPPKWPAATEVSASKATTVETSTSKSSAVKPTATESSPSSATASRDGLTHCYK